MLSIPAKAILDQFVMGKKECNENPDNLKAWIPMFTQYGPALLVQCVNQGIFGKDLVENWLTTYMFKDKSAEIPKKITEYLSNHENFLTHSKHINIIKAKEIGLDIDELEKDNDLQNAVLSAFHAVMHTLSSTNTVKVIANHEGRCFLKQVGIASIPPKIQPEK
jgi:hypothetical protein